MRRASNSWLLPVSVVLAILLGLVPLPDVLQPLRPYWLGLVVAYWVIEDNERVGLVFAFCMGLVADLAFGSVLGEQALRLVVMAFILQRFRSQLRFFPVAQQALAIGGLLLNDRVVSAAVHLALGLPQLPWAYWLAPLLGMLLWRRCSCSWTRCGSAAGRAERCWAGAGSGCATPGPRRPGSGSARWWGSRWWRCRCWCWRAGISACRWSSTASSRASRRPTGSSRGRRSPGED